MAEEKKTLWAPPVIQRAMDGSIRLVVAGYPVEGLMYVQTVCGPDGSCTTLVFNNSAVLFDTEKETEQTPN